MLVVVSYSSTVKNNFIRETRFVTVIKIMTVTYPRHLEMWLKPRRETLRCRFDEQQLSIKHAQPTWIDYSYGLMTLSINAFIAFQGVGVGLPVRKRASINTTHLNHILMFPVARSATPWHKANPQHDSHLLLTFYIAWRWHTKRYKHDTPCIRVLSSR